MGVLILMFYDIHLITKEIFYMIFLEYLGLSYGIFTTQV